MIDAAEDDPAPLRRRSVGFVLGYGASQAGAFICFIPLLTLLLPGRAEALGGADKALLLSQVAILGGLTAAGANLLFGALSDSTISRWGRRRPWMLAGLLGVAGALSLIALARDPVQLILAVVVFQLAVNALYAPLLALVPDMAPDSQKGLLSSSASVALPIANLFTALVVSRLAGSVAAQFAVVIAAAVVLVLPFALTLREPRRSVGPVVARGPSLSALSDGTFRSAFASRLLAESAVAVNTLYLLFFVQGRLAASGPVGWSAVQLFGVLLIASTGAAAVVGLIGGVASDRLGRRRGLVAVGCVGMAASAALMVAWPTWPGALVAQILFGAAHGLHATTVAAMTAEILPDRREAGRDLGLMNMAVALPQSLAPAGAAILLGAGLTLSAVFLAAAVAAGLAALCLAPMRGVR